MDATEIERLLDAPAKRGVSTTDLTGPVTILADEPRPDGGARLEIQASRLVAVDPDDPAMADVAIPVPAPATIEVGATGRLTAVDATPIGESTQREARAFARSLIDNGAVRGLSATGPVRRGPPARPTHEVVTDARGRRVIRRIGFGAGLDAKAQHGPTPVHARGGTNDA